MLDLPLLSNSNLEADLCNKILCSPPFFRKSGSKSHIALIEGIWKDGSGTFVSILSPYDRHMILGPLLQWLDGCWFYRPEETFHLSSRKFYEKVSSMEGKGTGVLTSPHSYRRCSRVISTA